MFRTNNRTILGGSLIPILFILLLSSGFTLTATAQVILRPSLGLQTFAFTGDGLAAQPMSPASDRALPLGGGLEGGQFGMRLQLEVMSDVNAILRFPVSLEYFELNGKTTFGVSSRRTIRKQRITFTHDASIVSANIGATAAFFNERKLYVSGELKGVYVQPTKLYTRIYYADNDSTIRDAEIEPFDGAFRIGGFLRAGAQLPFFDPFLLDFNVGVGAVNLFLKETDPDLQENLMVIEKRTAEEGTLSYFSIGISVIWKL
jgi:hypothetical protein